mgnify:CR=1 FL=1
MNKETEHSPFEELYNDASWQRDIKLEKLSKLIKILWKVVISMVIIGAIVVIWVSEKYDFEGLVLVCAVYTMVIVAIGIVAGIIALFLTMIPAKPYEYKDRLIFAFLVVFIPVMLTWAFICVPMDKLSFL